MVIAQRSLDLFVNQRIASWPQHQANSTPWSTSPHRHHHRHNPRRRQMMKRQRRHRQMRRPRKDNSLPVHQVVGRAVATPQPQQQLQATPRRAEIQVRQLDPMHFLRSPTRKLPVLEGHRSCTSSKRPRQDWERKSQHRRLRLDTHQDGNVTSAPRPRLQP